MSPRLSRALLLIPVALACLTYAAFLNLEPKALDWVAQLLRFHLLIACYWVTVIAALASLLLVRRHPKVTIASLILTALILYPPTETALFMTIWSIRGFAP